MDHPMTFEDEFAIPQENMNEWGGFGHVAGNQDDAELQRAIEKSLMNR